MDKEKILKWCGFLMTTKGLLYGDAQVIEDDGHVATRYPDIDISFFFQYAVPKLRYASIQFHGMTYVADVCADFAHHFVWSANDPAEAFGEALEKLIGERP